ncbi:MAG: hypothetical protein JXD23_04325 [Spirochaetales bacterium]|nr:hypothetical protein [Spirochaetales bacterium]
MSESKSLENYKSRLDEVKQLLDAHKALTRIKNAESLLNNTSPNLQTLAMAVQALVQNPGPGRPQQVQALNAAGIALLSAHLQGYIVDVFKESVKAMFGGKIQDEGVLIKRANTHGNPNSKNIISLFQSLGFSNVLEGISWQKLSNAGLRKKLDEFNELRNRIVHGKSETVYKAQLENYYNSFWTFGIKFDINIYTLIKNQTGTAPW